MYVALLLPLMPAPLYGLPLIAVPWSLGRTQLPPLVLPGVWLLRLCLLRWDNLRELVLISHSPFGAIAAIAHYF